MIQRETQTPTYWHNFIVSEPDLEHITTRFIEDEQPLTLDQLTLTVMRYRCRREEELVKRKLSEGALYQPRKSYEVGQTLIFPALGYASGELVSIRPGHNPEYGEFRVARVNLEGRTAEREFAIELDAPHRLNYEGEMLTEGGLLSVDELYELHGDPVSQALEAHLHRSDDFVGLLGRWFLKSLLIEINVGHLNLAEALLDMANGGPLLTEAFLKDLDLPAEIDDQLKVFSLDYTLGQDERFDEVGPAGQMSWYLRAREPAEVLFPPRRLVAAQIPYDHSILDSSLIMLAQELEDEWAEMAYEPEGPVDHTTLSLTFPHWRVGTLPLSPRLKRLFPTGLTQRLRLSFKDAQSGKTWPGWVVGEKRYVFGLDEWYREHDLLVGAYIDLRRGDEPGVIEIDFHRRRPAREWVRVAVARAGHLTFEMRKQNIGCEYDELMAVTVEDRESADEIWVEAEERKYPVTQIMYDVFPQLAKLNPQGTVHAKTLYSAVNVIRRLPPGPIFATLVQDMAFLPVGDDYWLFAKK